MIQSELENALKEVFRRTYPIDFDVLDDSLFTHPKNMEMGDFATGIVLSLSSTIGKNPLEIATEIAEKISVIPNVARVVAVSPGFINFYLSRNFFVNEVQKILDAKEKWGTSDHWAGERVMVEYTSPNLFKPLHIGNLMSNIIGETTARLFEADGALVTRVNYPSDIGLTVAKGVWGLTKTGGDPDDIQALGEAYKVGSTAYDEDEVAKKEIETINKSLYAGDNLALNALRERGIATSKKHLEKICRILGTEKFDLEIFESEAAPEGQKIVEAHLGDGIFEKSDNAVVFKGEKYDLHTRVFINSMGLPTYEAKDVGLMSLKQKASDFDLSITTTAVEQKEYFRVVIKALELIFPNLQGKLKHLAYGFLTLTTGKMSSRKGNVITGESLIEDMKMAARAKMEGRDVEDKDAVAEMVAVAAIKYAILRQSTGRNVVFDPEKSLSFEGDSGPYLQYAHTRALSILSKAKKENILPSTLGPVPDAISKVERLLYRFPEVVERATAEYEPHYLTTYLTELAGAFNAWYANEQIVNPTDPTSPYKVACTNAFQVTMANGLRLLGIRIPQEM